MKDEVRAEHERFERLGCCARKGGVVFLGSTYWAKIPVSELAQDFPIDLPIYNRSIRGLRLCDAESFIDVVSELQPSRIFIGLGDADLENNDFDINNFLSAYEWLLYTLHSHCNGVIYIVSIVSMSPHTAIANNGLRRLAGETGCSFIDISDMGHSSQWEIRTFETVKRHILPKLPRFEDVFFSLQ